MRCLEVLVGKVTLLVIALFVLGALAAPACAQTYQYSWSSPYSPYGMYGPGGLSSIYGPLGPFGLGGMFSPFGGLGGYSPYGYYGNSPYGSYYSTPSFSSPSSSLLNDDLFSSGPFANLFDGGLFKAKQYGPPPEENITKALIGQRLPYSSGFMGIPLLYEVEEGDIGDITGTQYRGADAWKVRVGQPGMCWDVIMDETGNRILSVSQAY